MSGSEIVRRRLGGETEAEIAEDMGLTAAAVNSAIQGAISEYLATNGIDATTPQALQLMKLEWIQSSCGPKDRDSRIRAVKEYRILLDKLPRTRSGRGDPRRPDPPGRVLSDEELADEPAEIPERTPSTADGASAEELFAGG